MMESWFMMRARGRLLSGNRKISMMGRVINAVLWKWYWVVMGGAVLVTYTVYTHLPKGLIEGILGFISSKIAMLVRVSAECTPLILQVHELMQCLNNTN